MTHDTARAWPFIDEADRRRWQRRLGVVRPLILVLSDTPELRALIEERLAPAHPTADFLVLSSQRFFSIFENVFVSGVIDDADKRLLMVIADAAIGTPEDQASLKACIDSGVSAMAVAKNVGHDVGTMMARNGVRVLACGEIASELGRRLPRSSS